MKTKDFDSRTCSAESSPSNPVLNTEIMPINRSDDEDLDRRDQPGSPPDPSTLDNSEDFSIGSTAWLIPNFKVDDEDYNYVFVFHQSRMALMLEWFNKRDITILLSTSLPEEVDRLTNINTTIHNYIKSLTHDSRTDLLSGRLIHVCTIKNNITLQCCDVINEIR